MMKGCAKCVSSWIAGPMYHRTGGWPATKACRSSPSTGEEYFAGERQTFDLFLKPLGTDFQQSVWQALTTIPFAVTTSYGQISQQIHRPKASRAVGAANGRNPIPIIIPCHRVIGSNGTLTGFAGGLAAKQWLLEHEIKCRRHG